MAFVVVYDACVLYPAHLRDFLLRLAAPGVFQAKWSQDILDEVFDALLKQRPELKQRCKRTRDLMNDAIPDVLVEGYEALVDGLKLPDPHDRHVLAAAIRCHAQVIVTWNVRDFPRESLQQYGVEAQTPDEFVHHVVDLAPHVVADVLRGWAAGLRRPSMTPEELLDLLDRDGLRSSAALLRRVLSGLPPHRT